MVQIELSEEDIFKIMAGSFKDRLDFFIADEIMVKLDLGIIKSLIQNKVDFVNSGKLANDELLSETIQFLQYVAYNRHKSRHSEEIATFVIDKFIEILCDDFPY